MGNILNRLANSHFLFVPSVAGWCEIVFLEASACGVPSIAKNVGGVSTGVRSDINGYLFAENESVDSAALYLIT